MEAFAKLKQFYVLGLLALLASCATSGSLRDVPPRARPAKAVRPAPTELKSNVVSEGNYREVTDTPEATQYFQEARIQLNTGQKKEAIDKVSAYLKSNPDGQFADEAAMLLGKQAQETANYEQAERYYSQVAGLSPPSRLRAQAIYNLAQSQSHLGERKGALSSLAKIDSRELAPNLRGEMFRFWGQLASEEGRWIESTLAYIKAYREVTNNNSLQSSLGAMIESQIQERLNESELNLVLREYPLQFPAPAVQLRLVTLRLADGRRDDAVQLLQTVLSNSLAETKYRDRARALLNRVQSSGNVSEGRIGALVPLSGDQEPVGRAIADGLQLALSTQDFQVVQADCGPSVETAAAAFDRLVFEEKVMAIVGPVSGAQVEMAAGKAAELGIPYIALSPRAGLLEKGPSIFRVALTPERQVRALVGYAWDRLNARNFAILFPEDNFGKEFATDYFHVVQEKGGNITAAESYDPKQSDFRIQLENMVGTAFPGYRKTEFEARVKLEEEKVGRKLNRREAESTKNPPIADFDILFIPDTYKEVGQIAPAVLYADVTNVQLIGPSTWHNPKLLERAGNYLDKALFVDMFAAERQSKTTQDFVSKFKLKKGSQPNTWGAVGYDVGLALRKAFGTGSPPQGRDELRSRLENLGSVDGALGLHVWDTRRDSLAELQLFQIKRASFHHFGGILLKEKAVD